MPLGGMNAREIRTLLRGKIDPEVGKVLVGLAERQDHLFQLLQQVAQSMDLMANTLMAHGNAMGSLMSTHDDLKHAKRIGVNVAAEATGERDKE